MGFGTGSGSGAANRPTGPVTFKFERLNAAVGRACVQLDPIMTEPLLALGVRRLGASQSMFHDVTKAIQRASVRAGAEFAAATLRLSSGAAVRELSSGDQADLLTAIEPVDDRLAGARVTMSLWMKSRS